MASYPPFVLPLKRHSARLGRAKQTQIEPLIAKLEKLGGGQLNKMIERAMNKAVEAYEGRLARLHALSQHNPNMPKKLGGGRETRTRSGAKTMGQAQLSLDSVRLVFCG